MKSFFLHALLVIIFGSCASTSVTNTSDCSDEDGVLVAHHEIFPGELLNRPAPARVERRSVYIGIWVDDRNFRVVAKGNAPLQSANPTRAAKENAIKNAQNAVSEIFQQAFLEEYLRKKDGMIDYPSSLVAFKKENEYTIKQWEILALKNESSHQCTILFHVSQAPEKVSLHDKIYKGLF